MRNYTIPGISAKLVDYQLQAEPITTPGDIVIILCDLPDELTIPDPDKTGEFLVVPVPANVPILINQTSELKSLITGDEIKNGIVNATGKDQHLAIVNILPLLKTEKPVALCKIIRRNGERPDVTINKELYEAMDFAYEHLGNYPAGAVVNAEIGFEDEALIKNQEIISEKFNFNSSLTNISISAKKQVESVSFKKSFVTENSIKITVTENGKTYEKTVQVPTRTDNVLSKKYYQLKELAEQAKTSNSAVIAPEELIELLESNTIEQYLNSANAESGKIVNANLTPFIFDIATLNNVFTFTLKPVSLNYNEIREDEVFGLETKAEIIPASFVLEDGTTYAFSNVTNPLAPEAVDKKINALTQVYTPQEHIFSKSNTTVISVDRTYVTCEQLNLLTDIRIKDKVLIDIDKTKNKFTSSALLTIEDLRENFLVINGEEIEIETLPLEGKILTSDIIFNYKGLLEIKLLKGLELDFAKFNYELSVLPLGASFDKRTVQFCHKLTEELNECIAYFGTKPPKTTSAKDIEEQVTRLYNLSQTKNYADTDLDKGLYLNVVVGAHKSGTYGGITNFPQTVVKSIVSDKVTIDTSLSLNIGDKIELSSVVKGKTLIEEFVVEDIIDIFNAQEIKLNKEVGAKIIGSKTTKLLSLVNKKDTKGTYLAAMYACFANGYLDKAPMNVQLPGESEVFYTNKQIERLLDARMTPVNRKPFNTNGVIKDTPTMAMPTSDFTDQSTVGLVFYLIRQLRVICEPKIGKKFGDAAKQMLFQEELEAPFKTLLGTEILDYKLDINFAKLNKTNKLEVGFYIKEAKKLKSVSITAKMF